MISGKIIALVLAGVLVVGTGVYVATKNDDTERSPAEATDEASSAEEEREVRGTGSIRSILAIGGDLSCDFTFSLEDSGVSSGTIYVSGQRMRGDFTMVQDGENMEAHLITEGSKGYSWGTSASGSMAVVFDMNGSAHTAAEAEVSQSVDLDQQVQYECERWTVDESQFEVPQNLNFIDISSGFDAEAAMDMQM